jgi:hypothetical protein
MRQDFWLPTESVTDPEARLTRKTHHGAAFLGYQASVLMENRHGLIMQTDVRTPGGHAETDAALELLTLLDPTRRRRTLGADKGYDTPEFIAGTRALGFTPHVSPNPRRYRGAKSAVDGRTTRHPSYAISQRKRKLVEQGFWLAEMRGPVAQAASSRVRDGELALRPHQRRVQSRPHPIAAHAGARVSARVRGTPGVGGPPVPLRTAASDAGAVRHCDRRRVPQCVFPISRCFSATC